MRFRRRNGTWYFGKEGMESEKEEWNVRKKNRNLYVFLKEILDILEKKEWKMKRKLLIIDWSENLLKKR